MNLKLKPSLTLPPLSPPFSPPFSDMVKEKNHINLVVGHVDSGKSTKMNYTPPGAAIRAQETTVERRSEPSPSLRAMYSTSEHVKKSILGNGRAASATKASPPLARSQVAMPGPPTLARK